ncbi:hypothetical protein [Sandarakinorhabdus sp.]|uniref:hypothetical protein n=1 Tax=Sandarakinorhabdus sp. TaxID=1916663 RepID=UPI003342BAB0
MKFKVISCWYGFSHHTVWDTENQEWGNVWGEGIQFQLVPICQTEIHFDNGQVFCRDEVSVVRNFNNSEHYVKTASLYINNQEKYGTNEELIKMGSSIKYNKENKHNLEEFFNLEFFHPLIGIEFQTLKNSIINDKLPTEIHINFERNGMKTFHTIGKQR